MTTEQNSQYWTTVIADLDAKRQATQHEIEVLAERKAPLCLKAHLGDKSAMAEIEAITAESRDLASKLPDLETAREQAQRALQDALQQEQKAADWVKAGQWQDAIIDRLWLLDKLDRAANAFVDVVVEELEQRERLERLTGVEFKSYRENSLVKTLIVKNLIDRHWQPGHHLINMERGSLPFKDAADSVFGSGWIDQVNSAIFELVGPTAFREWPIPSDADAMMELVPAVEPTT